jgi:hypothetical protein
VGQFVALTVEQDEMHAGIPFYLGKVLEFGQQKWAERMKVLWYWPCMGGGVHDTSGSNIARYANCMEAQWEPSRERHGWVVKEATIFSWEDVPTRTKTGVVQGNDVRVYGVETETKVKIPAYAKPHLLEYIDLQMEAFDEDRLRSDLDAY